MPAETVQPATPATPLTAIPPTNGASSPQGGKGVDAESAKIAASLAAHRAQQATKQNTRAARIAAFAAEEPTPAAGDAGAVAGKGAANDPARGDSKAGGDGSQPAPDAAKTVDGSKPNPELSKQIAASLRVQAEANKAKIEYEKKARELEAAVKWKQEFDADPFAALEKINPNALADWVKQTAEGKKPAPMPKELVEAIETAKAAKAEADSLRKEANAAGERAARAEAMDEIRKDISGDRWELVRSIPGADTELLNAALKHFEDNAVPDGKGGFSYDKVPWTTFAEAFEGAFIDQLKPVLQTKAGRAKFMELLGVKPEQQPTPGETSPQDAQPNPMRTITNHMASSAPAARSGRETPQEARARILRAAVAGDV